MFVKVLRNYLLHNINECNRSHDLPKCMMGSTDVESIYPSIDIEFAVERCIEIICESQVFFQELNTRELGILQKILYDNEYFRST